MNLVVLNGRLVRDPELKFGQSGKAYSRFSIAVDRPFQTSTDSQTADFINCVAFSKLSTSARSSGNLSKKSLQDENVNSNPTPANRIFIFFIL